LRRSYLAEAAGSIDSGERTLGRRQENLGFTKNLYRQVDNTSSAMVAKPADKPGGLARGF